MIETTNPREFSRRMTLAIRDMLDDAGYAVLPQDGKLIIHLGEPQGSPEALEPSRLIMLVAELIPECDLYGIDMTALIPLDMDKATLQDALLLINWLNSQATVGRFFLNGGDICAKHALVYPADGSLPDAIAIIGNLELAGIQLSTVKAIADALSDGIGFAQIMADIGQ